MKYLVTGGTGFVGAHVVRAILDRGHEVRCVTRRSSPTLTIEGLDIEKVVGDITDPGDCERVLRGCDGLYHVAGIFASGADGEALMRAVHVDATRTLFDACLTVGIGRAVLCSSSVTLPYGSRERPAAEDDPDPFVNGYPYKGTMGAYFTTKREAEAMARDYSARGLEVVVVNPDYVLGPWDLKPTSGQMILQIAKLPWVPFYPPGGKTFIDAADCGLGHVLAMEKGRPGERYLLGNENLSYREFMAIVAQVVGRPRPRVPLPMTLGRAVGKAGDVLQPWLPPALASLGSELVESMFTARYRTAAKARQELGLPQTSVKVAVERAWAWFVEHGYAV